MEIAAPWCSTRLGGERMVRLRALTAGEFYAGVPGTLPKAECWQRLDPHDRRKADAGWELWADQALVRALEAPALGVENLWQLGPDRDHVLSAYFRAVGFFLDPKAPAAFLPSAGFQDLLRRMSRMMHRLPHELLDLPVEIFNFNARILFPELFAPKSDETSTVYTNDPALMEPVNG